MQKVSKGLLDVLYSQFGSKPQSVVFGGIAEEMREENLSGNFDDSSTEIFEEEDDGE